MGTPYSYASSKPTHSTSTQAGHVLAQLSQPFEFSHWEGYNTGPTYTWPQHSEQCPLGPLGLLLPGLKVLVDDGDGQQDACPIDGP